MPVINEEARKRLLEEGTLFVSVLKWSVIATFIGGLVGTATSVSLIALNYTSAIVSTTKFYYFSLPVALALSAVLIKYLAPEAEGHGTEKVIEAIHERSGRISVAVIPIKLVASVITIAFGGSAGKEGPCAQIGAGISSSVASIFRMSDDDRKKIVICGISGGFASVFGTPIADALFGIEVLYVGQMLYDVLLPSFVSGLTAYYVSSNMGIKYFHHAITFVPSFTQKVFWETVLAGVFFGIVSLILIEMLHLVSRFFNKIGGSIYKKALLGGTVIAFLGFFVSSEYLGLGMSGIENMLAGKNYPWYSFLAKAFTTSITLSSGGSGGIITPIFFIGVSAGNLVSRILHVDPATFASMGMVAVLSGCANTPIAASVLAIELFGAKIAPYAALACVVSFIMSGHRSVYPSQKLGIRKSASIKVKLLEGVEDIQTIEVETRKGGVLRILISAFEWLDNIVRKIREKLNKYLD
jgi:H+/Cl- antiporter ClcA